MLTMPSKAADMASGPWVGLLHHLRHLAVVLTMTCYLQGTRATSVYFSNYAHCGQKEPFSLQEDMFTVEVFSATGSIHETLFCNLTFRSPPDTGVCLTFNRLHIVDCGVTLHIYHRSSSSDKEWRKLSCDDEKPSTMCTSDRYVTLRLAKKKLNDNKNYDINILVEKASNLSGQVILASSIGLFVGIIVGVVVLIVTLAIIVLCCCCKPCKTQRPPGYAHTQVVTNASTHNHHVQPSAPPASEVANDEHTPLQSGSLYPSLPQPYPSVYGIPEAPPPYAPPPYEHHLQTDNYPTKV
ncbi:hypothetical protein C0Q70_15103 [Pomacea canaliculata]|uniref:CUB domain-containing protein n=1 Tax=Pomacea canaliculata TaxID=400727 RepID=A0A2T7NTW7_POMCA|nr:uncharacterized protein LOC112572826 [Pomacea canaliculata]XP_025108514.1 uncharacterized protein LOC112572826 [Pomacea canaliculata]PVD24619.1 hypothetical protein C0Q70_15103 [Pomacea canaliculata]